MSSLQSPLIIVFAAFYLLALIVIAYLGKRAQKETSLDDFYLGKRSLGTLVLFLTFYATQYSGNTLIGFSAKTYRSGYWFIVSVLALTSVIAGLLIIAPKLFRLSREYSFITPVDYIRHRYQSATLSNIALLIFLFALGNYMVSNLKAAGHLLEFISIGKIPFATGVISMAVIMVVYETIGGLRSVAWTDMIQGSLILSGVVGIFILMQIHFGSFQEIAVQLQDVKPSALAYPAATQQGLWLSMLFLFFSSLPLYPHAIQRIYSAKSKQSLKKAIKLMAFMPLCTTFFMFIVGIQGLALAPELSALESEKISLVVLDLLIERSNLAAYFGVIFLGATVAAIMSTVDSALLSTSSMLTHDFYRHRAPQLTQEQLTKAGKLCSWIIMSLMVYLAIVIPNSIWSILEIKLEILCQLSPCFYLGIVFNRVSRRALIAGLLLGLFTTIVLLSGTGLIIDLPARPLGVHAGIWGLIINYIAVVLISKVEKRRH